MKSVVMDWDSGNYHYQEKYDVPQPFVEFSKHMAQLRGSKSIEKDVDNEVRKRFMQMKSTQIRIFEIARRYKVYPEITVLTIGE